MVINLNQPYFHIVNFGKLYAPFTLVLEKYTVLVQFFVEPGNEVMVPICHLS